MSEPFELPGYEVTAGYKPTEWMQAKLAQMARDILAGEGDQTYVVGPKGMVISLPLGGLATDRGSEEDMTCDKCNKVVLEGLWTFGMGFPLTPTLTVMVNGGLCDTCAEEEGAKPVEPQP